MEDSDTVGVTRGTKTNLNEGYTLSLDVQSRNYFVKIMRRKQVLGQ